MSTSGILEENRDIKNMQMWINKCGGRVRFTIDQKVDMVVVEMDRVAKMIESFLRWRLAHFSSVRELEEDHSEKS